MPAVQIRVQGASVGGGTETVQATPVGGDHPVGEPFTMVITDPHYQGELEPGTYRLERVE